MARRITVKSNVIHAKADESDDDVTIEYTAIKAVTGRAALFKVDGDEVWIPFSQIVDVYPGQNEALITKWIATEKGLA